MFHDKHYAHITAPKNLQYESRGMTQKIITSIK